MCQAEDVILTKVKGHDRLLAENADLQMKVKLLQLDKDKLHGEVDKVGIIPVSHLLSTFAFLMPSKSANILAITSSTDQVYTANIEG